MRQFFLILGAVFIIVAGISPIKSGRAPAITTVEIIPSRDVLENAATRQSNQAVKFGVVSDTAMR